MSLKCLPIELTLIQIGIKTSRNNIIQIQDLYRNEQSFIH